MIETEGHLSFDFLANGEAGLTPAYGSFLAEAASHCLHLRDHSNPVRLLITGDERFSRMFRWGLVAQGHRSTYGDLQEATEYGAYGIAIVVAMHVTGMRYVERSARGTGIDLWLNNDPDKRNLFQHAARLEVSGIFDGDESKVASRLKTKLIQTKRSDTTLLCAYVVIVEFGLPQTRLAKKTPVESEL